MQSDHPIGGTGLERETAQPSSFPPLPDPATSFMTDITEGDAFVTPRRDRIAILIDGASLFYAALQLQIEIDYLRLLNYLRGNRQLLRAYFYTGSDRSNERQQGFLLWMRRNGYRVVTKDLVTLPDGSRKANLDVEIAIDMMTLGNYCDTLVLLSGTGDLSYAVNALAYRGVKIEIVSLRANTSDALINLADRFTDLADIQTQIRKIPDRSD